MKLLGAVSILVCAGLLIFHASITPSTALAESDDLPALKKDLKRGLLTGDINAATLAIQRISELNTKKAVDYLINVGLRVDKFTGLNEHSKMRIFDAARQSLPKVSDEKAREFVYKEAKRLKKPQHTDKKVFLTEIIGNMKGKDAEEALLPLLKQGKFLAVQLEAIGALARRRSTLGVAPLINILEKTENNPNLLWKAAGQGLVEITGYSFPTAADWKNFWEMRKGKFDPEKDRGKEKARGVRTKEKKVPTFFDVEILSKRPVFVIDISMSMHVKDPTKGGEQPRRKPGEKKKGDKCPVCGDNHRGIGLPASRMRLERVKKELVKMIQELPDDAKFNILAFSTEVLPWTSGSELVAVTEQMKMKAVKFVQGLTYEQYTSIDYALEQAFAHREATAFYVLSDGTPYRDREPLPKEPILETVRLENKTRKVRIVTFGFSEEADKDFLKRLAKQNDGTFTSVY